MLILPEFSHAKGLFFVCSDLFYLFTLSIVCAWVHYTMQACRGLWKIMEVNEALQSPPSSPYSGVIGSDTAGHRRRSNRNALLLKSHCSPPLRGVSYRGNGCSNRGEVRVIKVGVRFSVSTICTDTCDFFLIFRPTWNMEDDLIKFCLGWIQILTDSAPTSGEFVSSSV